MALAPLHKEFGIKRCIMSTYQAASGAGAPGMNELKEGAAAISQGGEAKNEVRRGACSRRAAGAQ